MCAKQHTQITESIIRRYFHNSQKEANKQHWSVQKNRTEKQQKLQETSKEDTLQRTLYTTRYKDLCTNTKALSFSPRLPKDSQNKLHRKLTLKVSRPPRGRRPVWPTWKAQGNQDLDFHPMNMTLWHLAH